MTTTTNVLVPAKFAENSETTQYTSTRVKTILDKFTVTNVTAAVAVITVRIIPSGGSAGASNAITFEKAVAIGTTELLPEIAGQVLGVGEKISTLADTASALVIRISGREIS